MGRIMEYLIAVAFAFVAASCTGVMETPISPPAPAPETIDQALPYPTLQALELAAGSDVRPLRSNCRATRYHIQVNAEVGHYAYIANGRFAIARVDTTPDGDVTNYIWLGYIRDKGVLEVDSAGPYDLEKHGYGPCPWLYGPETVTPSACGARTGITDLCT